MRVAAGNHERKSRRVGALLCAVLQKHRVDVAFQVIHRNERLAERPGQRLGISHAHEQGSGEPGALGHGDGVEIVQLELGALHCLADDGGNVSQMLARGELRHNTSPPGVDVELRRDDARKGLRGPARRLPQPFSSHELSMPRMFSAIRLNAPISYLRRSMRTLSPQEAAARGIIDTLRSLGHQAYYAGGCVRDRLLGLAPKDFDIATSATPDLVLAAFQKTFAVGAHFGVVLVVTEWADAADVMTEVATFRKDGAYSDGRRPDAVRYSNDPREDVLRRDFTINGMLWDPIAEQLLDFVGGESDLRAGRVRAIGEPARRFAEDKLRMLRAVRFAARFGFVLEAETERAIRAHVASITQVSQERIRDELTRMLTEGHARAAFAMLDRTGLLRAVLPEIDRMHGVEQPPEYHPEGDVWVHTLLLLAGLSGRRCNRVWRGPRCCMM